MARKANELPKISIVIPSYNKVNYITATLQSIVDQKYPNLEVLVQDGGSTDGTVDVINKFAKKYPKIFKWVSKKDNGQVDAINTGFKNASGEIFAYINADDVFSKSSLLKVGKMFTENPDCLWVTGYGDIINDKGKVISSWVTKYKNFLLRLNSYEALLAINFITQPSTFIRKTAYLKYGPFAGTKKYVMEYELWLKLGKISMPCVIKELLSSFRLTTDNISSTSSRELLSIDYKLAQKYTKSSAILFLHKLHNWGRIGLVSIMKVI